MIDAVTPLVITFNEAPNIARTLDRLRWAKRVVVVDSGSTDGTVDIVGRYSMADLVRHPFESFAAQCNFGLSLVTTEWCLRSMPTTSSARRWWRRCAGWPTRRASTAIAPRSATVSTAEAAPRVALSAAGRPPSDEGSGVRGPRARPCGGSRRRGGNLRGTIDHDDRKPLSVWYASQQRYARAEATHILAAANGTLSRADRIRRNAVVAPFLVLFYVLFAKGCILDGRAGWLYALQRMLAEILLAIELTDRRLKASAQQE